MQTVNRKTISLLTLLLVILLPFMLIAGGKSSKSQTQKKVVVQKKQSSPFPVITTYNYNKPLKIFSGIACESPYKEEIVSNYAEGNYFTALKKASEVMKMGKNDTCVAIYYHQLNVLVSLILRVNQGIMSSDHYMILSNIEAAQTVDREIMPEGSSFPKIIASRKAVGHLLRAQAMEKSDNLVSADEHYNKCLKENPSETLCADWINKKLTVVRKLYSRAQVLKSYNPEKAEEVYSTIMKLVTYENEYYKKAELDIKTLK